MSKIVITGGHHNSALVVAQYFSARGHQVFWIGHRYSSRGDHNDSAEYLEVTSSQIPFYDLSTGRLVLDIKELLLIPKGIFHSLRLLGKIKPDLILSFGGYLGASVSLAGLLHMIPLYLHEQTVTAGKANRFLALFAKRIYITWEQSKKYFPSHKTKLVGLPLRKSIISAKPQKLFARERPTLLVMGGKLGAHVLNQFIFTHLPQLLNHFNIIHQTGTSSLTMDREKSLALLDSLGSLSDSYLPLGYISEAQIGKYFKNASLYLGRSGGHICYELLLLRLKAVLVPLTTTHAQEQLASFRFDKTTKFPLLKIT